MSRLIIFLMLGILLSGYAVGAQTLSGEEIMKKVDTRKIPKDMKAEMTMKLIDRRGKIRARTVRVLRQGDEKQIMWFLGPPDIEGTSFLRISHEEREDDMWLYLPAFGKIRRIASHVKKESFMGTDFTYEDMEKRKFGNYTYKFLKEDEFDKFPCYLVESVPKKEIITDYSKIISWVWKTEYIPVKEEFYDKRGKLKKIKNLEQLEKYPKYWIPEKMLMKNLLKEHQTVLIFDNIQVDTGINDSIFSKRYLKRIR